MKIARLLILTPAMLAIWIVGVLVGFTADLTGWVWVIRANAALMRWFLELGEAL